MAKIDYETKDSGQREEFATGSRRDTREGKGRFDLIPWEVIRRMACSTYEDDVHADWALEGVLSFLDTGDEKQLCRAAVYGLAVAGGDVSNTLLREGGWYAISPKGIERLAKLYERGAAKYGDRNWEKGQPLDRYIDSALRHMNRYRMGDTDEDHLIAFVWNVIGYLWTKEKGLAPATGIFSPKLIELKMAEYKQAKEDAYADCRSKADRAPGCKYCDNLTRLEKELGL